MQAVAAHELAHISCGDAYYVTLVCSCHLPERLRSAVSPRILKADWPASGRGSPFILIYGA
jgi:Zn-dependent protease with chaperone function